MDWWISSLRQKYHFEDSDVQALIALLLLRGEPVFPLHSIAVYPAPHENHLLEIAVTGHASALVTTGSQLLRTPQIRAYRVRHLFQDIPIITPAAFLRLLG